jgi:hypothetical protein
MLAGRSTCDASPPLTADTITDEQILDLRTSYRPEDKMRRICNVALSGKASVQRTKARARCALILNARSTS